MPQGTLYEWEIFQQQVLDPLGVGGVITNRYVAQEMGWPDNQDGWTAGSRLIQLYLVAQRGQKSRTKYILDRHERTRAASWVIGKRTEDARHVVGQYGSDLKCRMRRAIQPDLIRVARINPRAVQSIEQQLDPMLEGLVSIVDGMILAATMPGTPPPPELTP